jgi:hypothetical protein
VEGHAMLTQKSRFNRNLLIILVVLFVLSITAISYAEWAATPTDITLGLRLLNIPILAIPFLLIYGSIYVLLACWREYSTLGQVNPRLARIIHWAPRIAAIAIILFLGLFSLDVFDTQATPLELLGGFLIHNIPSIILIVLLILAWKRPLIGFATFLIAAVLFIIFFVRSIYALQNFVLFVIPILLIAALFYADWKWLQPAPSVQADTAI